MPGSAPENIPQAMKMKNIYIKMKKFADPTFLCFDESGKGGRARCGGTVFMVIINIIKASIPSSFPTAS